MSDILSESTQRRLVGHVMSGHPLPWTIEIDWTVEVIDALGGVVIKCMNTDEANEIMASAVSIASADAAAQGELEKIVGGPL